MPMERTAIFLVTDWSQMTASLMQIDILSELYDYRLAPNDLLLDAKGNAQQTVGSPTGHNDRLLDGNAQQAL